jgi:hypothetical protein
MERNIKRRKEGLRDWLGLHNRKKKDAKKQKSKGIQWRGLLN